jgi:hypothetical protein
MTTIDAIAARRAFAFAIFEFNLSGLRIQPDWSSHTQCLGVDRCAARALTAARRATPFVSDARKNDEVSFKPLRFPHTNGLIAARATRP